MSTQRRILCVPHLLTRNDPPGRRWAQFMPWDDVSVATGYDQSGYIKCRVWSVDALVLAIKHAGSLRASVLEQARGVGSPAELQPISAASMQTATDKRWLFNGTVFGWIAMQSSV
ncbi:MAG: hypothetical protein KDA58_03805 [Planctomycetaceae bacterium]|nr:hypothetical protein [Planctomycetaceae bacterium]